MLFYDFFEKSAAEIGHAEEKDGGRWGERDDGKKRKSAAKMGHAWKDDVEGDGAIRSGSLTPNQRNCSCAFQENGC